MNKMLDFIKNNHGSDENSEPADTEDKSFWQEESDDLSLDAMLDDVKFDEPDEGLNFEKWSVDEVNIEDSNAFSESEVDVENSNAWLESGNIEVAEEETTLNGSWLDDNAAEEQGSKTEKFAEEESFPAEVNDFGKPVFEQDMSLDFSKSENLEQNDPTGMGVFADEIDEVAELVPEAEIPDELPWGENESVEEEITESELVPIANPEIEEYKVEEYTNPRPVKEVATDLGYINWYSGSLSDECFEVSKTANSETIYGYQGKDAIHINVGSDTYGWNVEFVGGLKMSLRDVKIYQLRQGHLPAEQGVITYGNLRIDFVAVKRITVYETVEYFSY